MAGECFEHKIFRSIIDTIFGTLRVFNPMYVLHKIIKNSFVPIWPKVIWKFLKRIYNRSGKLWLIGWKVFSGIYLRSPSCRGVFEWEKPAWPLLLPLPLNQPGFLPHLLRFPSLFRSLQSALEANGGGNYPPPPPPPPHNPADFNICSHISTGWWTLDPW